MRKILLSSSAVMLATGFVSAADLPVAEPVDYVRVCDAFGTGFHYIPGTETCLKFSGRVRAEIGYADGFGIAVEAFDGPPFIDDDATFMNSNFELVVNASSMTEIGMLSGQFSISGSNGGDVEMGDAWITIGENILVGRETSSFDFGGGYGYYGGYYGDKTLEQFTFIMPFGNGFSATLGLEDGRDRRADTHLLLKKWGAVPTLVLDSDYEGVLVTDNLYGGMEIPDIVASLRLSQSWGSAQLSGALHQLKRSNALKQFDGIFTVYPSGDDVQHLADNKWGWAVQGGVELNVGAATKLKLVAAYADGALAYLGGGMPDLDLNRVNVGPDLDNIYTVTNTGWYALAGLQHQFTNQLTASINGSYHDFIDGGNIGFFDRDIADRGGGLTASVGYNLWQVDGTLEYEVVDNLLVGVGAMYQRYNRNTDFEPDGDPLDPWTEDDDSWEVKLRVQRNF